MSDDNDRYEECELGRDVTHLFRSTERKATAILPVSLKYDDVARLEKIAGESGKSIFQVIRDAIAAYQPETEAISGQR